MWYKDGRHAVKVFDSSSPNTGLLKGEIFGSATQKNCTTRFDNASHNISYFFRLEASGKMRFSLRKPTYSQVQIAILGSPPKPTVRLFRDQQQMIEGSSVSLRCSTKIFCPSRPPSLTWSSSLNENVTGRQYQSQTELISDLNFTVSHRHHGVTFTCNATHQLQQQITTQESRMLRVQYAPKNTSVRINPAGLVLEGRSVTLSCSSDANPAVNYTWYRDTEELLNPVQTGPDLTIIKTNPTHRGRYYCTAENKHGSQNTSVLLDVQQTNFCLRPADDSQELSHHSNPLCKVNRNDGNIGDVPPHWISDTSAKRMWYKDGRSSVKVFDSSSPNTGLFKGQIFGSATQKNCTTRFDNVNQSHDGSYFFRVEANGSPPKPAVSVFKDQQEVKEMMEVMEGSSVSLRCSTKIFCLSHPPSLTWSSSLNENITGRQYQSQTELISDLNFTVSHRHHGVTFTCSATHQLQEPFTTQRSRVLRVQYAPKRTSLSVAGLVLEGRSVTLSCSSDANPAVNYTWYRDTEGLLNPVQTGPDLTITNTTGRYYCTAENKHGTQNTSVLLDVQQNHFCLRADD
ncbi:B-cell receptor CD22-like [Garra rufa]|uniref:B-cell receptor CD22-like n=1 Tax=Garra rufa TaxID=137080 RepID=UPI003CCEB426